MTYARGLFIIIHFLIGILGLFGTIYGKETNSNFISSIGVTAYSIYMTLAVLIIIIAVIFLLKKSFIQNDS